MQSVGKYNLAKGISTVLTIGTPIAALAACSGTFLQTPHQTMSATGIFAILIALLFFKDKIAENFKMPTPLVVSVIVFVLILLIESILQTIKFVCIATIVASGVDELTCKRIYKQIEGFMPKGAENFKMFGFYFTSTKAMMEKLKEIQNEQQQGLSGDVH